MRYNAMLLSVLLAALGLALPAPGRAAFTADYDVEAYGDGTANFLTYIAANRGAETEVTVRLTGTLALDDTIVFDGVSPTLGGIDSLTIQGVRGGTLLRPAEAPALRLADGKALTLSDVTLRGHGVHGGAEANLVDLRGGVLVLDGETALQDNLGLIAAVTVMGDATLVMRGDACIRGCVGGAAFGQAGGVVLADPSASFVMEGNARVGDNRLTEQNGAVPAPDVSLVAGSLLLSEGAGIGSAPGQEGGLGLGSTLAVEVDETRGAFSGYVNLYTVAGAARGRILARRTPARVDGVLASRFYSRGIFGMVLTNEGFRDIAYVTLSDAVPVVGYPAPVLDLSAPGALHKAFGGDPTRRSRAALVEAGFYDDAGAFLLPLDLSGLSLDLLGFSMTREAVDRLIAGMEEAHAGLYPGLYHIALTLEGEDGTWSNVAVPIRVQCAKNP